MTTNIITYEQPLNEHIRLCLRLEHLFERCREHIADKTASGSRIAITALLKVLNVVDRPDLKTKLSQVLSQQVGSLAQLEQSPRVDAYKLQQALTHLDQLLKTLHQTKTK